MAVPSIIDTRVLGKGKPDRFYGKETEWEEWKDQFESWAGLLDATVGGHLQHAARLPDPIPYDPLSAEMKVMTKLIFHVLMNLCKKRAGVIVRRVLNQHGFEAYRRLSQRYNVQTEGRHLAALSDLLHPEWKKEGEAFEDEVEDWERLIEVYERDAHEIFPDSHKKAILMNNTPAGLKEHLFMNMARMTTYEVTKQEVVQYLRSKRTYGQKKKTRDKNENADMDVDAVEKGKGGGKKGKPKGKFQDFHNWTQNWNNTSNNY